MQWKNYFLRDDSPHDLNAYMADFLPHIWFRWVLWRWMMRSCLLEITHLHFNRLFSIFFSKGGPQIMGGASRLGCRVFLSKVLQGASTHTMGPQLTFWLCSWSKLEFHEFTELPSWRIVADCTNLTFSHLYWNLLYTLFYRICTQNLSPKICTGKRFESNNK